MSLQLYSEFGTLELVLTHRPSREIERLTPYNRDDLLFEDVPYLEVMQQEHDYFTDLMRITTGTKVLKIHDLLVDILLDTDLKTRLLYREMDAAGLGEITGEILARYSTSEIATILIAGIRVKELQQKLKHRGLDSLRESDYIIRPCPNLYFMRDPAAVVQSGVICSRMKFSGRQRESNLLRAVFGHHELFRRDFKEVFPCDNTDENATVEGGDIILLSEKSLAIGCSERTTRQAIEHMARTMIGAGDIERVYEVDLPTKRNFMHLDTVFTIIDENLVLTYPDALESVLQTCVYTKSGEDEFGEAILQRICLKESLISLLKKEIPHLEVIQTGDGNPDFSLREQWYDGANVFAISPRRVISYDRNKFTNRALREAGVEVIETKSSELSRGLGGPRCMTMPLQRKRF